MVDVLMWVVPLGILALLTGWSLWAFYQIYSGVTRRIPEDITYQNVPPPPLAHLVIGQLAALGFRRLGEMQLKLPTDRKEPSKEWVFVHENGTIMAEVGAIPNVGPLVSLTTSFRDGSLVETSFPLGEKIEDPDYRTRTVRTSLEDAFRRHQREVDDWQPRHGSPERVEHMGNVLRLEVMNRDRFGKRKLTKLFIRQYSALPLLALVIGIGWLGARLWDMGMLPSNAAGLAPVLVLALAVLWTYWQRRQSRG